ncbi:2-dehydropantoate 2-reductase, partial [Staphylococcus aureus]
MQLKEAMEDIKPHIDNEKIVLCTMNVRMHEEVIAPYASQSQSVRGVTTWTAGLA